MAVLYDGSVQAWIFVRWAPRLLRTQPMAWAALGICFLLWLSIRTLSVYGITTKDASSWVYAYDVAFMASTLGGGLACGLLGRHAWLAGQLASQSRLRAELLALWACVTIFQATSLILPICLAGLPAWSLFPRLLSTSLHWSALGLVLLRVPMSATLRPIALWALGWWVPALLEDAGWIASRTRWLLATARYLETRSVQVDTLPATLADMAPAGTLILIALLFRSPSGR